MTYSMIKASTVEAKKVKAERNALQHILSFDGTQDENRITVTL